MDISIQSEWLSYLATFFLFSFHFQFGFNMKNNEKS